MSKFSDSWTPEVEGQLNRMRLNSIELSERHRLNSFSLKSYRKYFDIPTIILSTMASSFAIGATRFISQHVVSLTNCGINMFIAMLTSIKLYLNLDETFKNEQAASRAFEYLALDLSKMLRLKKEQRNCDGLEYLNKIHAEYVKLKGNSKLLSKNIKKDFLLNVNKKLLRDDDVSYSGDDAPGFITLDDVKEYNEKSRSIEKKNSTFGNLFTSPVQFSKNQLWTPKRRPTIYTRERIEKELQNELIRDLGLDDVNYYHDYGDVEMQNMKQNKNSPYPDNNKNLHNESPFVDDNKKSHDDDNFDTESIISIRVHKPKQNKKLLKQLPEQNNDMIEFDNSKHIEEEDEEIPNQPDNEKNKQIIEHKNDDDEDDDEDTEDEDDAKEDDNEENNNKEYKKDNDRKNIKNEGINKNDNIDNYKNKISKNNKKETSDEQNQQNITVVNKKNKRDKKK